MAGMQQREARAPQNGATAPASHAVCSRDRSVEVTVGPQGALTGLRFLDGRYLSMPPRPGTRRGGRA